MTIIIFTISNNIDILPSAGKCFINKLKLLIAAGVPSWLVKLLIKQVGAPQSQAALSSPHADKKAHRVRRKASRFASRASPSPSVVGITGGMLSAVFGRPAIVPSNDVFNLDFLLSQVMRGTQRLDWATFEQNERHQPLHIIACSTQRLQTVALSRDRGNYCDLNSLLACIRASMSVPGVTGPMMAVAVPASHTEDSNDKNGDDDANSSSAPKYSELKIPFPIAYGSRDHLKDRSAVLPIINDKNVPVLTTPPVRGADASAAPPMSSSVTSLYRPLGLLHKLHSAASRWRVKSQIRLAFLWRYLVAAIMSYVAPHSAQLATATSSSFTVGAPRTPGRSLVGAGKSRTGLGLSSGASAVPSAQASAGRMSHHTVLSGAGSSSSSSQVSTLSSSDSLAASVPSDKTGRDNDGSERYEGLIDAFVSEPIPYRSAVQDGATHVLVLRTKPDSCVIKRKGPGVFEKFIARRFLSRYREAAAVKWMMGMEHVRIYIEDSK